MKKKDKIERKNVWENEENISKIHNIGEGEIEKKRM